MDYWWIPATILLVLFMVAFYKRYKMFSTLKSATPDSENLIILTDSNYKSHIKDGVCLIDFWAPWCMPCRVQGPIVSEVANEMKSKAKICKINIDENKRAAAEYGIRSIPTILIFKDGEVVKQFVGVKTKNILVKEILKNL